MDQRLAAQSNAVQLAANAAAREAYAAQLFDDVMATHSHPSQTPPVPTLASPAVIVPLLQAWEGVGGFLLQQPRAKDADKLAELYIELRSFNNPDVATRARRIPVSLLVANEQNYPESELRPLFLNEAHYPNQDHLHALRDKVRSDATKLIETSMVAAGDEVTAPLGTLTRQQHIAMLLYREVDGSFTAGINNALTLREELFHSFQSLLNVSHSYMNHMMLQDADTPQWIADILQKSKSEQINKRNAGVETAFERMERRLGYLLSERELQARIDKVCVEIGRVPQPFECPVQFLENLGVAMNGIEGLYGEGNSIWERAMINGKPSRALAELNFAIVAAFPDGISDYFRHVALPYHVAQVVRVNSFDKSYEIIKGYGFQRTKDYKPMGEGVEPKLLRGLAKVTAG